MIALPILMYERAASLFKKHHETFVRACLEGFWGHIWVDDVNLPRCAMMYTSYLTYFAGDAAAPGAAVFLRQFPWAYTAADVCLVPPDAGWEALIEKTLGARAERQTRWAIRHEPDAFDDARLSALRDALPAPYRLEAFDEHLYHAALQNSWSQSFCDNFVSWEHYASSGLGCAATLDGELVGGASTFGVYDGGIEVQVETHRDHRRRGIAQACCAALILACRAHGLYASWDAANRESVALAEKLGYHEEGPYTVYAYKKVSV